MKERPILFNGAMVRALLDGSKTQTRRAMREQVCPPGIVQMSRPGYCEIVNEHGVRIPGFHCPYGRPDDRLWVREAWRAAGMWDSTPPRDLNPAAELVYEADGATSTGREQFLTRGKYRPPMFMPRWASRITVEIAGVRVERLQDIGESDALAEGITYSQLPENPQDDQRACTWYRGLWEMINGAGSWGANPWVWVVEFRRIDT